MTELKDLDEGQDIDKDEFLAGVAKLAEEAGDWRDHLPYEAFRYFNQRDDIRAQFGSHVDSCKYCRELIEVFGLPGD